MNATILAACVLDLSLGDPPGIPHPVRWIGAAIAGGEQFVRARFGPTPSGERMAGATLAIAIVLGSAGATAAALAITRRLDRRLGWAAEVILAASALATRDLLHECGGAYRALADHDLPRARIALARIVGRDTHALDEAGVARAIIETLAESTCDGVIAPLVYLAFGGVPAAVAFKALSTLDSMIGHREPPYTFFGTVAARLDDAANFLPARCAALAIAVCAPLVSGSTRRALATVAADALAHRSPNAGFPEAAMAGALGVRLGGPLAYDGAPAPSPLLGAAGRVPDAHDVACAMRLCASAALFASLAASLATLGVRRE